MWHHGMTVAALGLAMAIGLVGCDGGADNGNGNGEAQGNGDQAADGTLDAVGREAGEMMGEIEKLAERQGSRFVEAAEGRYEKLAQRWSDLRGRVAGAAESEEVRRLRERIDEQMTAMRERFESAGEQAEGLGADAKERIAAGLTALSRKLNEAAERLGGDAGEGEADGGASEDDADRDGG